MQPNYGLLSVQAAVHRGATQRLLGELLQRLGVHILSGRPLKVWQRGGRACVHGCMVWAGARMFWLCVNVYVNMCLCLLVCACKRLKGT